MIAFRPQIDTQITPLKGALVTGPRFRLNDGSVSDLDHQSDKNRRNGIKSGARYDYVDLHIKYDKVPDSQFAEKGMHKIGKDRIYIKEETNAP